jgi:hypothetical protein
MAQTLPRVTTEGNVRQPLCVQPRSAAWVRISFVRTCSGDMASVPIAVPDWSDARRRLDGRHPCRSPHNGAGIGLSLVKVQNFGITFGDEDVCRLNVPRSSAVSRVSASAPMASGKDFHFQRTTSDPVLGVTPSRNSMAMNEWPSVCRFRRWCRCW